MTGVPKRMVLLGLALLTAALSLRAETLAIGGSGSTAAIASLMVQAYKSKFPQDVVTISPTLGSNGGLKALSSGVLDVALVSRPLKPEESSRLRVVEVARTPFVLAVAISNPLNDITLKQLASMYESDHPLWADGRRVRLVLRDRSDTETVLAKSLSAELARAIDMAASRLGTVIADSDDAAIEAINKLPGGLGWTTLAQISIGKYPLKALALEGRKPTVDAAREASYPLFKQHSFVVRPDSSPAVLKFIEFAHSPEAQRLLAANGCWVRAAADK